MYCRHFNNRAKLDPLIKRNKESNMYGTVISCKQKQTSKPMKGASSFLPKELILPLKTIMAHKTQ